MVMPGMVKSAMPGLSLSGSRAGRGGWRIDFDENSAHTQCGTLSSQPRDYAVGIKNNLAVVNIDSEPKTIVLTLKPDGTMVGTGPLAIKGYIITSGGGGGYDFGERGPLGIAYHQTTHEYTPLEASSGTVRQDPTLQQNGQTYSTTSSSTTNTYVPGAPTYSGPTLNYTPKTENCTQATLVSQGPWSIRDKMRPASSCLAASQHFRHRWAC
jgi:hypothetical protein